MTDRPTPTSETSAAPRTEAGQALRDYMASSFVYEADDTEPVNITDRILAIEREARVYTPEGMIRRSVRDRDGFCHFCDSIGSHSRDCDVMVEAEAALDSDMTSETPAAPNIRYPALIEANNRWQNETRTHAIRRDSFIQGAEWAAALAARPALDVPLDRVLSELREEVGAARIKHAPMHSPHEGWAVILEELTPELWEHVCHDTGRSPEARKEALQVAAMGVRYILDLIDDPPARLAPQEPAPEEPR